ncbi:hypothetical protein Pcinc_019930 [Petrolisthes cinctipes]|uniref:Uncharacterized protein n=1 Tax=Petrolisthes cinctipes TaxID=88211 RepID=A0AAE1FJ81_PETCI|nr:hypothetical protein Pcinc_019930 [Petrolisthes cinctipes]
MVAICSDALLKAMSEVFGCLFGTSQGGIAAISSRIRIFNSSKLCGRLLNTIWKNLKIRIREEIAAIPLEMCRRAAENFRHRLQQCIATDGPPSS